MTPFADKTIINYLNNKNVNNTFVPETFLERQICNTL